MSKLYKTLCCNYEYISTNHSPVLETGYCLRCGYHPEIEKLNKALEIAKEKLGFYADIKSWGFINQDESHKTWAVINESDTEIHVNKKLPEEIYDLGGKRARQALKEIEEIL